MKMRAVSNLFRCFLLAASYALIAMPSDFTAATSDAVIAIKLPPDQCNFDRDRYRSAAGKVVQAMARKRIAVGEVRFVNQSTGALVASVLAKDATP
jgi:hypothetical protein